MLKRIRIDNYHFRIRKGRADVLLQRVGGEGTFYCVPFHYVEKNERILSMIRSSEVEDDEELVINDTLLGGSRIKSKDVEWIPLSDIPGKNLLRNESHHVLHNILRYFLTVCPLDTEPRIRLSAESMLDAVLTDIARKRYVERLQRVLEGKRIIIPDCSLSQPDLDLVKKEIDTLEHFHVMKPDEKGYKIEYSFEPINWEAFGSVRKMFSIFHDWDTSVVWFENKDNEEQ